MKSLFRFAALLGVAFLYGCSGTDRNEDQAVLVSTLWLQEHLDDPSLVILHVGEEESYNLAHIPGAQYIHPSALVADRGGLRNEFPGTDAIDSVLASKGIEKKSRIVLCYEDRSLITRTARIFLTLDYVGMGRGAHLLNGGLERWMEEGRETTGNILRRVAGALRLEANPRILLDAGEVAARMDDPEYLLIDSRSVRHFQGGHIAGAVNLPYTDLLSDSVPYLFSGNDEMIKVFEEAGMNEERTLIHSCGSGMSASVTYLVARHLGYRSLFYDGSYEDWRKRGLAAGPAY